jgi:hypothetical protein
VNKAKPIDRAAQKAGAEDLVKRSRLYDQNAMAMIAVIRENMLRGDPTAKSAFGYIVEYIRTHPVKSSLGVEALEMLGRLKEPRNSCVVVLDALMQLPHVGTPDDVGAACAILAQGPTLTDDKLGQLISCIQSTPEKNLFHYGYRNSGDSSAMKTALNSLDATGVGILCAGHCIGMGRKIQMLRERAAPISILSGNVAWEFGCIGRDC